MHVIQSLLLSYAVNSLWQAPLLFLAGWLIARALRPAGPAAEHRAWVGTLLLQSLLPALCLIPRQWFTALLRLGPSAPGAAHAQVAVFTGQGIAVDPNALPSWLPMVASVAYLAICGYFAARFLWRWTNLRALRSDAIEVALPAPASQAWTRLSERFGITRTSLAASSRIAGPVTLGHSRRLVLLPAAALSHLLQEDFPTVVAHEFAHIRRNDFLKNLLYELLALPIAYHPFLWLARERVIESRELVCDQIAARATGQQHYTQSLLRLANLLVMGPPARTPNTIGIFDAAKFERRLMNLSEMKYQLKGVRRLAAITACAMFGLATCASGLALAVHVDQSAPGGSHQPYTPNKPVNVSPHIMQGNRIGGPMPKYPVEAKKKKIQGTVILDATISKTGAIEQLKAVSGPKVLQQSALDAVRKWTYKPYLLNGKPVTVKTVIQVVYSLAK